MTAECRRQFRFTNEDKRQLHEENGSACTFPGEVCERPNNGIVHHLTGAFEAWLDHKDSKAVSDINMNAFLLCSFHAYLHDIQERFQVESLLAERRGSGLKKSGIIFESKTVFQKGKHHRVQRRRHR